MTQHELLCAHAKVQALQKQLGLSYKDASHWLYHGKFKRLQADDLALKTVSGMVQQVDEMAILNIKAKITAIDEGRSGNAAAG